MTSTPGLARIYDAGMNLDRPDQPNIYVCRVCRIGATQVQVAVDGEPVGPSAWLHARGTEHDHAVEPVLVSDMPAGFEVRTVCDLCGEPAPANLWYSQGTGFTMNVGGRLGDVRLEDRDEAWAVCDGCVPAVRAGDVAGLMRRRIEHPIDGHETLTTADRVLIADRIRGFLLGRDPEPRPRPF